MLCRFREVARKREIKVEVMGVKSKPCRHDLTIRLTNNGRRLVIATKEIRGDLATCPEISFQSIISVVDQLHNLHCIHIFWGSDIFALNVSYH
jgi:hypothetical protein